VSTEGWVCLHVHLLRYQDEYLREVVRPLFSSALEDGLVDRFFFLRYWQSGPHVRVRLHACDAGSRPVLRRSLLQRTEKWLWSSPPVAPLDSATWMNTAIKLAMREGESDVLPPLPHGSLVEAPYRPEHHRYGRGEVLEAVEKHFTESSRLALVHLDQERLTRAKLVLAAMSLAESLAKRRASPETSTDSTSALVRSMTDLKNFLHAADGAPPIARVLRDCAHLLANRLGFGPSQEAALRALVSAARGDGVPA
jgi:hypothetical protein